MYIVLTIIGFYSDHVHVQVPWLAVLETSDNGLRLVERLGSGHDTV